MASTLPAPGSLLLAMLATYSSEAQMESPLAAASVDSLRDTMSSINHAPFRMDRQEAKYQRTVQKRKERRARQRQTKIAADAARQAAAAEEDEAETFEERMTTSSSSSSLMLPRIKYSGYVEEEDFEQRMASHLSSGAESSSFGGSVFQASPRSAFEEAALKTEPMYVVLH
eukprot:TRINITY_DN25891_c0_g1_i1.p1 TRINITY_DN25891_c0_g1~~TRINITY_DN25891_c0_g1_i1.p1  ORF type:complete len:171 (+),score=40.55 TRINITY_DN25891_c0_g1_i1:83-595(+)